MNSEQMSFMPCLLCAVRIAAICCVELVPGDQFLRGLAGVMAPRQLSDVNMPIDAEAPAQPGTTLNPKS